MISEALSMTVHQEQNEKNVLAILKRDKLETTDQRQ